MKREEKRNEIIKNTIARVRPRSIAFTEYVICLPNSDAHGFLKNNNGNNS